MNFLAKLFTVLQKKASTTEPNVQQFDFASTALERTVKVSVFLPPQHGRDSKQRYPSIFFNDGQDMEAVGMLATLTRLWAEQLLPPCVVVAMACNADRLQEYGTASQRDYLGRGSRAPQYTRFVVSELVPAMRQQFQLSDLADKTTFAGFSLGALSALDIAWANPLVFGRVGVFSGSLWWRSQPCDLLDPDAHRIMHDIIARSEARFGMRFWLQTGTRDEADDRNGNGIIDSIDDTLDLINLLVSKGYRPHTDIKYTEVEYGEHNPKTWGAVMPQFLTWAVSG